MSRSEIHSLYFDTPIDAALFAMNTPRAKGARRSSEDNEGHEWDMGMDLPETLDKVSSAYVWRQGMDQLSDSMEITDELAARSELPRLKRVIAGGLPCVPAYVTGHPKAMYQKTKQDAVDRPVLSIGIQTGIAWIVRPHHRINFAAAMMSAANALESMGYRCELTALWRAPDSGECSDYKRWCNIEVTLKTAQERFNPASIAFVCAHPAVQRHMFWRILETQKQWVHLTDGYCYHRDSVHYERSMSGDFDIYFGNMASAIADKCETPEGAFKYVEQVVGDMLADMKEV